MCLDRATLPEGSKWWFGPFGLNNENIYHYGGSYEPPAIPYDEDFIVCRTAPFLKCDLCGKIGKVQKSRLKEELPDGGNSCTK